MAFQGVGIMFGRTAGSSRSLVLMPSIPSFRCAQVVRLFNSAFWSTQDLFGRVAPSMRQRAKFVSTTPPPG